MPDSVRVWRDLLSLLSVEEKSLATTGEDALGRPIGVARRTLDLKCRDTEAASPYGDGDLEARDGVHGKHQTVVAVVVAS